MPHKPPLSLAADDIDLIRRALDFYACRWTRPDAGGLPLNLGTLREALSEEVPVFPCYLLAWPGVTAEELAPLTEDDSENITPEGKRNGAGFLAVGTTDAGEVLINLPRDMTGHIAFSPDQADYLGAVLQKHADYARRQKTPPLECPVCRGSGDKGNPTRGFVLCNECDGTGEVLTHIPAHVRHMLGRVLPEFEAGRPARSMALLTAVVGNLFARIEELQAQHNETANEVSMRANGIQPD